MLVSHATSNMTLSEFKQRLRPIFAELWVSADLVECARSLEELQCPEYNFEVVKRAISLSLDKRDAERELVSKLISRLYPDFFSTNQIAKGFERLFEQADDLELDVPSAKANLSTFLARAVVDEVIPPSFLTDGYTMSIGGDVVTHAKQMLNRDHVGARMERIWGPGDGRPVQDLKVAVDQLLQEYIMSGEHEEAMRCVKELNAPFFHHEIVKRAVVTALDKSEDARGSVAQLLRHLRENDVISAAQFEKGFGRLYGIVSDLVLDVPDTPQILAAFTRRAVTDGVLPKDFRVAVAIA